MRGSCSKCGAPLGQGASICRQCGMIGSYTPVPPTTSLESIGIGGWLILVAIGLAATPFLMIRNIYIDFHVLSDNRFEQVLSDHPGITNLLTGDIFLGVFFVVALIALNYLFYSKNRLFPLLICSYLVLRVIVVLAQNYAFANLYGPHNFPLQTGGFIGAAIWIRYFTRSERVRATFVC